MFAEELSGNASKKRQEEARARRRHLKQQKQLKENSAKASRAPLSKSSFETDRTTRSPSPSPSKIEPCTVSQTEKLVNNAVKNANQQRQLRQRTQLEKKSVLCLQSFCRAHLSNKKLLDDQRNLLSSRLKDLISLSGLLKERTKTAYIPPPATASALVSQLLFLTRTLPYKRLDSKATSIYIRHDDDAIIIQQVLQHVLLPGIIGKDENLDPLLPWSESRLSEVIRLSMVVAVRPGIHEKTLKIIDAFLRALIGIEKEKARTRIVEEVRHSLFPVTPLQFTFLNDKTNDRKSGTAYPHEEVGATLDVFLILRHHMLFSEGGPIPENASTLRESCFSSAGLRQTDTIFLLVLDGIVAAPSDQWRYFSRFVTEILTIPLLTWKTSIKSTSKLLSGDSKPLMLAMLSSFVDNHKATLSKGKIESLFPPVNTSFKSCPATRSQCLLANLIQIGRACNNINGSKKTNYQESALFYNFIASLLEVVPLSTLSIARESAVEWISDGSRLTAVVLSPIVMEQCKFLLVDSFVRDLFTVAINDKEMKTDETLEMKTEKDSKLEKDLNNSTSAASLAAQEARINRSKSFWNSSKWAKNMKKSMTKMFPVDKKNGESDSLSNISSLSRKMAGRQDFPNSTQQLTYSSSKSFSFDPSMYFALCRAYGIILARWGGGGRDDIVRRKTSEEALLGRESQDKAFAATLKADPCTLSVLNVLCFSTSIVRTSWAQTQSNPEVVKALYSIIDSGKGSSPVRLLRVDYPWSHASFSDGIFQLFIFLSTLLHTLIITDDVEIHDMGKPIPLHQLRRCIQVLKKLLHRACCLDLPKEEDTPSQYLGLSLISASAKVMRDLYDRSSRKPLCLPKLWIIDDLLECEIRRCDSFDDYERLLSLPVLRICPFLVSFKRRLKLFERIVTTNRILIQGQNNPNPFVMDSGLKPGIPVRIMRGRVLEDGLSTMNKLGKNMRKRIIVHYLNEAGAQEAGVDIGGLFKEFWTDLCAIAFDPNYALFRVTEGAGNCMYPNPASGAAHGALHVTLFEFLGRILGKALYEGITIHPQFAHFFLSFLRGDYNFLHMLPDLSTMDPVLYNNLMYLKSYDGDAEDLCLTFTVANDDFGGNREIQLIPDGSNISVTNLNKQRYIGLIAKHYVCDRLKEQSQAFTRGLWDVIERPWLCLFNEPELQVLISGPSGGKIDIDDMKSNTRYAGGFTSIDRTVHRFWKVFSSLSSEQQGLLLRFVTSCERPPPLGFASMNPPFTIQRIGILRDGDRLPTAATCFNTLKLPTYSSEKIMRERLVYAIESGTGFELS